jgi:hypothetical protein
LFFFSSPLVFLFFCSANLLCVFCIIRTQNETVDPLLPVWRKRVYQCLSHSLSLKVLRIKPSGLLGFVMVCSWLEHDSSSCLNTAASVSVPVPVPPPLPKPKSGKWFV